MAFSLRERLQAIVDSEQGPNADIVVLARPWWMSSCGRTRTHAPAQSTIDRFLAGISVGKPFHERLERLVIRANRWPELVKQGILKNGLSSSTRVD